MKLVEDNDPIWNWLIVIVVLAIVGVISIVHSIYTSIN